MPPPTPASVAACVVSGEWWAVRAACCVVTGVHCVVSGAGGEWRSEWRVARAACCARILMAMAARCSPPGSQKRAVDAYYVRRAQAAERFRGRRAARRSHGAAAQHWRGKGLAMCGLCHVMLPGSPPSSIIVIGSSFCSRGATLAMVRSTRGLKIKTWETRRLGRNGR
eukprot:scaffold26881_cov52-Phaeocystis_antarctica.AAC.1